MGSPSVIAGLRTIDAQLGRWIHIQPLFADRLIALEAPPVGAFRAPAQGGVDATELLLSLALAVLGDRLLLQRVDAGQPTRSRLIQFDDARALVADLVQLENGRP